MMDWDALYRNVAKGDGLKGTTRSDEDAYFAAFADDPLPILPRVPLGGWLAAVARRLGAV